MTGAAERLSKARHGERNTDDVLIAVAGRKYGGLV
jgi:hypothetical protein